MTRISNNDQILLLLRQQLQRISGDKQTRRTAKTGEASQTGKAAVARLKALASVEEFGDDEFERTLVQGLLTDEFGEAIINDPRFQQLVDKVWKIIASDEQSRHLFAEAKKEILSG